MVFFSPLDDGFALCDAGVAARGYPELHTDRIAAANTGMKASLMAHVLQRCKPRGPSAAA